MLLGNGFLVGFSRNGSVPLSEAALCSYFVKFGPGVPLLLMIPSDSRFHTFCPFLGTYVAKTWSKLRFSPMITITCLIGDLVFPDAPDSCAFRTGVPTENWKSASPVKAMRRPSRLLSANFFSFIQEPPLFLGTYLTGRQRVYRPSFQ